MLRVVSVAVNAIANSLAMGSIKAIGCDGKWGDKVKVNWSGALLQPQPHSMRHDGLSSGAL